MPPLLTTLEGRFPIARHEHVAVLYRGSESAFRFASFLSEGLTNGDQCHYLAPPSFHRAMLVGLRGLGVDPDRYVKSCQLKLEPGAAEPAALQNALPLAMAHAERAHAPALRWLEEAGWAESAGFPAAEYFQFHALLNYQVKHFPSAAICQYWLDATEPQDLGAVLTVHRHLIIEDHFVRDNPFYLPPEKFLPLTRDERQRDVTAALREVGFDVSKLLESLVGYGKL